MMRRAGLLALALLAVACGDIDDDFDDTSTTGDGDTTGTGDGDGDGDGPGCEMQFSSRPANPERGDTVVLDGAIFDGSDSGAYFDWLVLYDDETIEVTSRVADDRSVEFVAERAGAYTVNLSGGSRSSTCSSRTGPVNVALPGADRRTYELRVTAPAGLALDQRRTVQLSVGSSFDLGALSLEPGIRVEGTVVGPDGPVGAYLRAAPMGGGPAAEAFAGDEGVFALDLGAAAHDVLVVPAGDELAPALLRAQFPADLAGDLVLTAAATVPGVVRDAAGAPVVGARVSLKSADVPSTVEATEADGAVSVQARIQGATSLSVVEPADEGALVRLEVPAAAGWTPGVGAFAVDYQASFVRRAHTFSVELPGGEPASNARLVLRSRPITGAAVLSDGAFSAEAEAEVRFDGRADEAGVVRNLTLPDGVYDVVALPPAGTSARGYVAALDLTAGAPAPGALRLATGFTVSGRVSGTDRPVQFSARPVDPLAGPALEATATSDDGAYSLVLAPGIDYVITAAAPLPARRSPARFAVAAGADGAGEVRDVTLGSASQLRGTVELPGGGGVDGAHVSLYCVLGCVGGDDGLVSEAVTGPGGRFALVVPD